MRTQLFKATVFIPNLSHFITYIEVEVMPGDEELLIEKKVLDKLCLIKQNKGHLLSKKIGKSTNDWTRLVSIEKVTKYC